MIYLAIAIVVAAVIVYSGLYLVGHQLYRIRKSIEAIQ